MKVNKYKKLIEMLDKKGLLNEVTPDISIIQLVGDRDSPSISLKECAFTIPANPMSDRGQMVLIKAMNENVKVDEVGYLPYSDINKKHQSNTVYSEDGLSPCLTACDWKAPTKITIQNGGSSLKKKLKKYEYNGETIRLFDSFAGIGALHQALKELGVNVEVVGLSEIDIDATISYAGVHGTNLESIELKSTDAMKQYLLDRNIGYSFEKNKSSVPRMKKDKLEKAYRASVATNNLGDISKLDYSKIPDFDLFNMSFPCTDISNAGLQKGLEENTRSGLYRYGVEVIKAKKPKYVMIENVKGLITKKFINNFYEIIEDIENQGYVCHYPKDTKENPTCLNAKNYGIPQNRERIFVICVRNDIDSSSFKFPQGFNLDIRLKDMLEEQVDEKYYLSDEIQSRFTPFPNNRMKSDEIAVLGTTTPNPRNGQGELIYDKCTSAWVYDKDKLCSTLSARDYKQPKQIFDNQINENDINTVIGSTQKNAYVGNGNMSPTLTSAMGTGGGHVPMVGNVPQYRIRKLTPKECWRLMGFRDKHIDSAIELGISNSALYKQAGNSIVVDVLYHILKELFNDKLQ